MLYLDTSILVCAFTNEAETIAIQKWQSRQDPRNLTVSDWVVTEFSSALSIKLRTGQLSSEHRAAALATFRRVVLESYEVLPVERAHFYRAAAYADQAGLKLRAGDALHLAICAEHGATLCTLDKLLGDAAPLVGVSIMPL